MDAAKRRYNRLAQQKHRGGKQSFVTQIENLKILLVWQSGEISEGQAAKILGMKRIEARELMYSAIIDAITLCDAFLQEIKTHDHKSA